MEREQLGQILMGAGVVVGVVVTITTIARHPVLIGTLVVGAAMYFVGRYLKNN